MANAWSRVGATHISTPVEYVDAPMEYAAFGKQVCVCSAHCLAYDLDDFLRGNPLERADVYQKLIPLGVLTVEEAREEEDLVR